MHRIYDKLILIASALTIFLLLWLTTTYLVPWNPATELMKLRCIGHNLTFKKIRDNEYVVSGDQLECHIERDGKDPPRRGS